MSSKKFLQFQLNNVWLLIVSIVSMIVTMLILSFSKRLSRKVPINYVLLVIFTLSMSYSVSLICGGSDPKLVMMAACMTVAVTLSLTLYAFTCKQDFTYLGASFFIFSTLLFIVSLFLIFTSNPILHIIYSALSVIFYAYYLIFDTQLILADKSRSISYDDYIIASVMLYTDII